MFGPNRDRRVRLKPGALEARQIQLGRELKPGFASEEAPPEPKNDGMELDQRFAVATYANLRDADAAEIWSSETLCSTCYHASVCKYAEQIQEQLIVVSRCRAYSPAPK